MAREKDPLGMMASLQAIQNSGRPRSGTNGGGSSDPADLTGHLDEHVQIAETGHSSTRRKISAWLSESIDSHDIVDHEGAAKDFREVTGLEPCWPTHTGRATRAEIQRRPSGGTLNAKPDQLMAWGYEIAIALASKYVEGFRSTKMGRGFAYREALDALRAVNL